MEIMDNKNEELIDGVATFLGLGEQISMRLFILKKAITLSSYKNSPER